MCWQKRGECAFLIEHMDKQQLWLNSLRALVLVEVGSEIACDLVWRSRTTLPTIDNLQILQPLLERSGLDVHRYTPCDNRIMELEESEGNWLVAIGNLTSDSAEKETVADLSRLFRAHVRPLERAHKTRKKHSTSWNSVVTLAVARNALPEILPMNENTLEALLWDALSLGASLPVLKGLINSIKARHRCYLLEPPLAGNGAYRRMTKTLSRFLLPSIFPGRRMMQFGEGIKSASADLMIQSWTLWIRCASFTWPSDCGRVLTVRRGAIQIAGVQIAHPCFRFRIATSGTSSFTRHLHPTL